MVGLNDNTIPANDKKYFTDTDVRTTYRETDVRVCQKC